MNKIYGPEITLAFIHCQEVRYRIFKGYAIEDQKRWIVAKHLTEILEGETQRYQFTYLLFGVSSTASLESSQIRALLDLLQVEGFGDLASEEVKNKIVNLYQYLLIKVNRSYLNNAVEAAILQSQIELDHA